ncbi:MAG: RNA methyltransferase [Proteobacteria bacterium]|nr:RNA methyltransferase [Pseudomonadota bacterium]
MVAEDFCHPRRMPAVILSHPQMGENIGAVARAMKNCGAGRLLIVNPRDGWPQAAAVSMAAGGADLLGRAEIFATTAEAVAPFHFLIASTARKRGMTHEMTTPREVASKLMQPIGEKAAENNAALLFGNERAGLNNDEVAMADMVMTIPLNPAFTSLNLAHAVLIALWECRMHALTYAADAIGDEGEASASIGERENFYARLEDKLGRGGFFKSPAMQPVVMRNLKALFNKARLTQQEVQTLHGVLRAVEAAGQNKSPKDLQGKKQK